MSSFLAAVEKTISGGAQTVETLMASIGGVRYEIESAVETLLLEGKIAKYTNTENEDEYCRPQPAITRDNLMGYIIGVGCACTYEISKHFKDAHMGYIDSVLWDLIQANELMSLEVDGGEGITTIYMPVNAALTWRKKGSPR